LKQMMNLHPQSKSGPRPARSLARSSRVSRKPRRSAVALLQNVFFVCAVLAALDCFGTPALHAARSVRVARRLAVAAESGAAAESGGAERSSSDGVIAPDETVDPAAAVVGKPRSQLRGGGYSDSGGSKPGRLSGTIARVALGRSRTAGPSSVLDGYDGLLSTDDMAPWADGSTSPAARFRASISGTRSGGRNSFRKNGGRARSASPVGRVGRAGERAPGRFSRDGLRDAAPESGAPLWSIPEKYGRFAEAWCEKDADGAGKKRYRKTPYEKPHDSSEDASVMFEESSSDRVGKTYRKTPFPDGGVIDSASHASFEEIPSDHVGKTYRKTPFPDGDVLDNAPHVSFEVTATEHAGKTYPKTPFPDGVVVDSAPHVSFDATATEHAGKTYRKTPFPDGDVLDSAPHVSFDVTATEHAGKTYRKTPFPQEDLPGDGGHVSFEESASDRAGRVFRKTPFPTPDEVADAVDEADAAQAGQTKVVPRVALSTGGVDAEALRLARAAVDAVEARSSQSAQLSLARVADLAADVSAAAPRQPETPRQRSDSAGLLTVSARERQLGLATGSARERRVLEGLSSVDGREIAGSDSLPDQAMRVSASGALGRASSPLVGLGAGVGTEMVGSRGSAAQTAAQGPVQGTSETSRLQRVSEETRASSSPASSRASSSELNLSLRSLSGGRGEAAGKVAAPTGSTEVVKADLGSAGAAGAAGPSHYDLVMGSGSDDLASAMAYVMTEAAPGRGPGPRSRLALYFRPWSHVFSLGRRLGAGTTSTVFQTKLKAGAESRWAEGLTSFRESGLRGSPAESKKFGSLEAPKVAMKLVNPPVELGPEEELEVPVADFIREGDYLRAARWALMPREMQEAKLQVFLQAAARDRAVAAQREQTATGEGVAGSSSVHRLDVFRPSPLEEAEAAGSASRPKGCERPSSSSLDVVHRVLRDDELLDVVHRVLRDGDDDDGALCGMVIVSED